MALSALVNNYEGIMEALLKLIDSEESNALTVAEAHALFGQIQNFKFLLGTTIWNTILARIDICNKALQKKDSTVNEAVKHLEGLLSWLNDFRQNGFDAMMEDAKVVASKLEIDHNSGFEVRATRGRKPKRFQGNVEPSAITSPLEQFKVNFFDGIMEKLISDFQTRFGAMQSCNDRFNFLWGSKLLHLSPETISKSVEDLARFYDGDFNEVNFKKETGFLKSALIPFLEDMQLEDTTPKDVINILAKYGLIDQFHNVVTALRIFLTLPVSVASNERSFSKLKIIKNYLRSTMGQERLSNLSILSIEHEIVKKLSFDSIINDFARKKCRKVVI